MDIEQLLKEMTLEEKAGLCSGHDYWTSKAVKRLGVLGIMMCDGPHGLRKQLGDGDHLGIGESIPAPCFPSASALAASFDTELLYELGEKLGDECLSEDVGMLLGPGVNMKRSPLCGRNFEYLSEDPYLAGKLAAAYIRGLQSKGVAACVKHFACNNQETMRMSGSSQVDERTLREIYLPAFEIAVREGGVKSVMCAYNQINGTYASENPPLLTEILRKEWGFDGFVVTDWGAIKDRIQGLVAGVDLEMPGGPGNQDQKIIEAVKEGLLDEAILNQAVSRILSFIQWQSEHGKNRKSYDITMDHHLTEAVAKECAVLLKNEGNILPLSQPMKVAFIGEFAEKPRYQGSGSSRVNAARVSSALQAAGDQVTYARGYKADEVEADLELMEIAVQTATNAQIAVIFAGLPDSYETEGADRTHLELPLNQTELIRNIVMVQPQTIVVLHGGSPVTMPWIDEVSAVLNMYLGGEAVGKAAYDILFGKANPSGKLAESWPLRLCDTPAYMNFPGDYGSPVYQEGIYIGYRYYDKREMNVLFPFGHGISYTSFSYRDLQIDKTEMSDMDTAKIHVKSKMLENTRGKRLFNYI